MKKIISYFFIIMCLFFMLPIFFTSSFKEEENNTTLEEITETLQEQPEEKYDYGQYSKIRLLHTKTNEVEEVNLDDYLVHVVSAEMPVDYEEEALKAQAVVARTYTIYKIIHSGKHENSDICDSSLCCQAWISKEDRFSKWGDNAEEKWNKIQKAVIDTKGKIITYNGEPINAFFHSNSGGTTEIPFNVWGGSGYPYLQVVETSGEDEYSQGSSEVDITKAELEEKMRAAHSDFQINWDEENAISILEYNESNRVKTIKIGNVNISGVEARSIFGLKSANFSVEISESNIKFSVKGYGHGVGLSQTGSNTLAKEGKNFEEIIKHFYIGVEIISVNL